MKKLKTVVVLTMCLIFSIVGMSVAADVSLQVNNEIDFEQPSLALAKYASLFVTDLSDFDEDPLLTLTVNNDYGQSINGAFSFALFANDGTEIGFTKTAPITVPAGETEWEIKAGGITNVELISDVLSAYEDEEESITEEEFKDRVDLGDVEDWEIDIARGNQTWVEDNIVDWSEYEDYDENDIPEIIDTILSLKVPSGNYRLFISFHYTEPAEVESKVTHEFNWQVTNPEPVELIEPEDEVKDLTEIGRAHV